MCSFLILLRRSPSSILSGYKLAFKFQASDVEMVLAPDMRLETAALKALNPNISRQRSCLGSRVSF